jgi:hypothetical protein
MEQQQKQAQCTCPASPARVRELCPACLLAWSEWREQDERAYRLAAAYGIGMESALAEVA